MMLVREQKDGEKRSMIVVGAFEKKKKKTPDTQKRLGYIPHK